MFSSLVLVAVRSVGRVGAAQPPEVRACAARRFRRRIRRPNLRSSARGRNGTRSRRPACSRSKSISSRARISTRIASTGSIRATGAATARGRSPTCAAAAPASARAIRASASNPPVSARWGDCSKDWPRENIVSPYPFKSSEEHYAALLADAQIARRADASTPTRRCRSGTASTASICRKDGASGTTAAQRRSRRSCRY